MIADVRELAAWANDQFGSDGWVFTNDRSAFHWVHGLLSLPEGRMRIAILLDAFCVTWTVIWFGEDAATCGGVTVGKGFVTMPVKP